MEAQQRDRLHEVSEVASRLFDRSDESARCIGARDARAGRGQVCLERRAQKVAFRLQDVVLLLAHLEASKHRARRITHTRVCGAESQGAVAHLLPPTALREVSRRRAPIRTVVKNQYSIYLGTALRIIVFYDPCPKKRSRI